MLGTALQLGAVRGEDRFYIPVKARKNHNLRKLAQKAKNGETDSADSTSNTKKSVLSENRNSNEPSSHSVLNPKSAKPTCNIDRFLESTTPLVPAQYFSKVDLIFFSYSSMTCTLCFET